MLWGGYLIALRLASAAQDGNACQRRSKIDPFSTGEFDTGSVFTVADT
jgi:hypothetical protein